MFTKTILKASYLKSFFKTRNRSLNRSESTHSPPQVRPTLLRWPGDVGEKTVDWSDDLSKLCLSLSCFVMEIIVFFGTVWFLCVLHLSSLPLCFILGDGPAEGCGGIGKDSRDIRVTMLARVLTKMINVCWRWLRHVALCVLFCKDQLTKRVKPVGQLSMTRQSQKDKPVWSFLDKLSEQQSYFFVNIHWILEAFFKSVNTASHYIPNIPILYLVNIQTRDNLDCGSSLTRTSMCPINSAFDSLRSTFHLATYAIHGLFRNHIWYIRYESIWYIDIYDMPIMHPDYPRFLALIRSCAHGTKQLATAS